MSVFPFIHICLDMKRVKNIYCLFFSGEGNIFLKVIGIWSWDMFVHS